MLYLSPVLVVATMTVHLRDGNTIMCGSGQMKDGCGVFSFLGFHSVCASTSGRLESFGRLGRCRARRRPRLDKRRFLVNSSVRLGRRRAVLVSSSFVVSRRGCADGGSVRGGGTFIGLRGSPHVAGMKHVVHGCDVSRLPRLIGVLGKSVSVMNGHPLPLCRTRLLADSRCVSHFVKPTKLAKL